MRSDRLLEIVTLLRRHDRLTADDLATRLAVSRRTVLRDLDALSLSGVPVYATHGRHGGYSLLPGYRPEQAGLTPAELEALVLPGGENAARALGLEVTYRSARRKLEAGYGDEAARRVGSVADWLLVAPEGWGEPEAPPTSVPQLASAAARRAVVEIDYRAAGQRRRTRRVRPLGLVLAGRVWYLVALRDDTGEQRTYRAERVLEVRPTGADFEPTLGLTQAWEGARAAFRGQSGPQVVLRTREETVSVVRYVLSLAGRVTDVVERGEDGGGAFEIHAVAERWEACVAFVTGLGDRAEIVSPPELVDAVRQVSEGNLRRYG